MPRVCHFTGKKTGFGHKVTHRGKAKYLGGVGMCQYCAQQRALEGRNYEQILMEAYPQAKFAKAY